MGGEIAGDTNGNLGGNLGGNVGEDFGNSGDRNGDHNSGGAVDGMFDDAFDAVFDDAAPDPQAPQAASSQDADPLAPLATMLAGCIADYHRRRRTLFEWLHPQRLAAFAYASLLPALDERRTAQLAETWLEHLGVRPAPLLSFTDPSFPLTQLPLPDSLCVLRMRALLEHVDEVRSWIDRPRRLLLNQWLGPQLARALLAQRGGLAGGNLPLAAEPTADALAWRGFRLFERDCGWGADHPMRLAQFALSNDSALAAPLEAAEHAKVSSASDTLISQLPELFAARSC
ncbi:type III secretion protein HrpB4 [Paraburkholderia sediminicola]|uniref:type III secretion protein HrpB4 n=1 Tax=Paraburkholderia sediminicola TaxID=458836 RepID=UPI0038BCEB24